MSRHILLVQVYINDIIFGSTKNELCTEFEKLMHKKFQMSSMGELTFFLGLQVKQKEDGIFISQDKSMTGSLMYLIASRPDIMFAVCACARFQVTPKVSHLHAVKRIFRYLKGQPKLGLWYPKDSPFDLKAYTDSDYAGASLDKKFTIGGQTTTGKELSNPLMADSLPKTILPTKLVKSQVLVIVNAAQITTALTKVSTAQLKLMLLNIRIKTANGEYDMWRLRIEQYFQVQDYALWDIIENGNLFKPVAQVTTNVDGSSTSLIPGPITNEEKYKDAQTLFAAIQTRFGGNEATKKTQKTLLKQMYENFSASSTESLDFIFNRLQKINTYVVVWRNKPDLDTMGFNDLYKNFKIVEQEVKGTTNPISSLNSQNMVFISSPRNTNEVDTAYRVSTANTPVSTASTQVSTTSSQVSTANLSDATLALLSMRARRFFQKTGRKITINGSDTAGYDKSKVECFNCHKMGHFARECRGPRNHDSRNMNQDNSRRKVYVEDTFSKAMVAIDEAGFDWSYMADDEVLSNMALMAFSGSEVYNDKTCLKTCLKSFKTLKTQLNNLRTEFNKSEFNLATYKRGLASVEEQLVFYKKNEVMFCEQIAVFKRDISYKDSEISVLKSELEKLKQEKENNQLKIDKFENASKSLDKLIRSQITNNIRKGVGFVSYNVVPPPPTGLFSPPKLDLTNSSLEEFQQPEFEGYEPKPSKNVSKVISTEVRESTDTPLVEKLVSDDKLEKKTNFPTVAKKEFIKGNQQENPVRKIVKYASMYRSHTPRRNQRNWLTASTIKGKGWPKVVNTARPNSAVVNAVRANLVNAVKASIQVSNMSYLLDFKEFDWGYVTFGGGANRGKITGKGTLKTGKLDFEDVYFVKELKFNLFSVSQMCDKNNSVLFTDTKCFVLSPDFKLVDESQVTLEESMLWHRRRNRTLIEAARTMLADSKLPTTFWAKAVNNACYVQNRVLVVKPHNMTPYELFRGRTPALSFMKPFGCHVTILNTLDYLGKFDGKSDEGFFVGYSLNSKAFRVYNIRTRKVEESLHIRFLEDKPIIAGTGPKWLFNIDVLTKSMNYVPVVTGTNSNDFVGTEQSIGTCHSSKETGSSQDYILMPLWKDGSLFDSSSKNAERIENSAQDINTVGQSVNTAIVNVNTDHPTLEATHDDLFGDETEVDMSNITTTYPVPSTPNTRIHKDHSLDHVIGDIQSGVQTKRMTKNTDEQGFISVVYEGKTHKDLHTCLFACFLFQEEPKRVAKALSDPAWVEAMQEELL
ncbi:ribonuclease H-like domain-containing protein [Tanacetum coccineum]